MPPSSRRVRNFEAKVKEQRREVARRAAERVDVAPPHLVHRCIEIDLATLTSGVYLLMRGNRIVYIGSSVSVAGRLGSHGREGRKDFNRAVFLPCREDERLDIEGALIRFFMPEYNGAAPGYTGKDDAVLANLGLPKMDPAFKKLLNMQKKLIAMRDQRREFNALDYHERIKLYGDYREPGYYTARRRRKETP